jgi:hypothetical protein
MEDAGTLPNWTAAPERKFVPEMITEVPPEVEPVLGETAEIVGAGAGETVRNRFTEAIAAFVS